MKKKILITGSTDGIGKLVAINLAKKGHQIYLHGRNVEKLNVVISEVKQTSKNENVKGFVADFSDLEAVKKMGDAIIAETSKIDVLINNAGIFKSNVDKTRDGFDIRFAVNYLAPFILTNKLIKLLDVAEQPRVINLSSAAQATVSHNALLGKENITVNAAYAQSKLALTMWSFSFAEKHKNILTIAVNPGSLLNTKMANEAYGEFWAPAEKGSNILFDLAISDQYRSNTGEYFNNDEGKEKGSFSRANPDAYDFAKIDELIKLTKNIIA